jgi:hypothetical protein
MLFKRIRKVHLPPSPENRSIESSIVDSICPRNGSHGKAVKITTLKSLLKPDALAQLNAKNHYYFCGSQDCEVVYFAEDGQVFTTEQLKVPVFPKELSDGVPICYCFNWTRERIKQHQEGKDVIAIISAHIQAQRCGCEFNNPQGRCCLADVKSVIAEGDEVKNCSISSRNQ